jgi:hypothetical protein
MFVKGQEELMFDELGNPFYRQTTNSNGDYVDVQPEQCTLPLTKELTIQVILKREGFTTEMLKKYWFGVQTIKISIPNEKALRYYYLVFDPKAMSNVCVKIISPAMYDSFGNFNSIAWTLSLNPLKESIESDWFKRGKPKTITPLKAQNMLRTKEALCILTDSGELAE